MSFRVVASKARGRCRTCREWSTTFLFSATYLTLQFFFCSRGTVDNNGGNPNWEESGDAFRGNYFFFHHTSADTMTTIDSDDMDTNTAMYAAIAYVVADLDDMLPREGGPDSVGKYCKGAHFPEGIVSKECACHTHRNATKSERCQSGWPDQEYYLPHRGSVSDGHWSDKRKKHKNKAYSFQHQDP